MDGEEKEGGREGRRSEKGEKEGERRKKYDTRYVNAPNSLYSPAVPHKH